MHQTRWGILLLVAGVLAACQANPPTVVYVVVTPTPDPAALAEVSEAAPPADPARTATTPPPASPTPPPVATLAQPTATFDPFPTDTVAQVQVAEQVYENGRMMWIQPVQQIWVMVDETGTGTGGAWLRYADTFTEGEDPENDPSLVPPPERYQPERGFGKLWRENDDVREALGWAVTPELGYISQYEYRPGGTIENDAFIPGDGEHKLFSLYGEPFLFHEATQTWELGS